MGWMRGNKQGHVEMRDEAEREIMKYIGDVWTERQRNERNGVNVVA